MTFLQQQGKKMAGPRCNSEPANEPIPSRKALTMSVSQAASPDNRTDRNAPCPDWCAEKDSHEWSTDAMNPSDIWRWHQQHVGEFVMVQGHETYGNQIDIGIDVYLGSDDAITVEAARQLASDLTEAARIVEGLR